MTKKRLDIADAKQATKEADMHLATMAEASAEIERLTAEWNAEIDRLQSVFSEKIAPFKAVFDQEENELVHLMKTGRGMIFSTGDIVRLAHGVLLRLTGHRVVIPKTALATCKELHYDDAIKTVESLIREVVETWPDEKLFLIGAVRKPREDFEYELRRDAQKG